MSFLAWAMMSTCTSCGLRGSVYLNDTIAAKCNDLGLQFLKWNHYGNAETMFRSAIHYKHDYVSPHTNLAFTYIAQRKYQDALPVTARALTLDPTNFLVHYYNGLSLAETARLHDAAASFEACLTSNPFFKPAYLHAGRTLLLTNDVERAVHLLCDVTVAQRTRAALYFLSHDQIQEAVDELNVLIAQL